MFIVGDFELWSVYDGIVGSKKGETDGEEEGEANRCTQTCVDGILCKLLLCQKMPTRNLLVLAIISHLG
jgi:hypothetical protein